MHRSKKVFSLTRSQACETLLRVYRSYYNIHRFDGGESAIREGGAGKGRTDEEVIEAVEQNDYPLISRCDFFEHSQKYVISRKAELWSADREEFLYLFSMPELTMDLFKKCRDYVYNDGMDRMNVGPGHMYTYLTAVFLCDSCDADVIRTIKKTRIYKSFHFSLHGWMDYHNVVAVFDDSIIDSNFSGKSSAKFYEKNILSQKGKGELTMNSLVLLLVCIAILICGYIFYGRWLCKQWGVGESDTPTPAHELEDGVDYVPAKAPVLMGHHFSSIAGAGPITGPIGAAIFGWVPVVLWVLIGGIFFGGVHDFGALFASLRHKGQSIGEIISVNMGKRAKRLFIIFAYLTLILVVAAFASIVAGTFGTTNAAGAAVSEAVKDTNASVAMVSLLFIVIAIIFGFLVYRRNVPMGAATIIGVLAIVACMAIGMNFHPIYLSYKVWMIIVGLYIAIASVTPVWILLQPRDYLSSFLLYAMLAVALVGVFVSHADLGGADGLQAFEGFAIDNGNGVQYMFPVLFTTVACGAISGFHSLVSSGTTSKQLDKEKEARPIAYGGMLLECVLAVVTVCAINYAYKYNAANPDTKLVGATGIFAGGIANMYSGLGPNAVKILRTLLTLTYSAFCLTSLDTATRLARFMFQEFWLEPGQTAKDVKSGWKKVLVNPYFATILTVVLGVALGMTGYSKIWGLFGAANQLLAGIGLLAVAAWLANCGKNNKMFLIPMAFMIVVTICSLCLTIKNQIGIIAKGGADWGPWAQAVIGALLVVLAIFLVIEGWDTLFGKKKKAAAK